MLERGTLDTLAALVGDFESGTVSLVGAGPGDSTLISVRGAVRLSQADVVLHDRLIGPELLTLAAGRAECVFVGKWRGEHAWTQDQINAALVEHARAGRRVVRLKGGDPFVFGRGGEECEHLAAAGISFEVVPGVTAAFGAPASAGIPLTHRDLSRSFALVTGHAEPGAPGAPDFSALARMETIALYMGVRHLARTCEQLVAAGMDAGTPVAVIQWGTRPQQRTLVGTLATIAAQVSKQHIEPPAMVLIGKVVAMRDTIEWFENRPLHGQRILVTRPREQSAELVGALLGAGAEVIEAPTLEIVSPEEHAAVDRALLALNTYDWLVLTSVNGVEMMWRRIEALGRDARLLGSVHVAAVGTATAEALRAHGIRADLVPPDAIGEALAEALIQQGVGGKRILLLRGDLARTQLAEALQAAGATCDDLVIYRTVPPATLPADALERLDAGEIDWITFTSPSSFQNLLALLGDARRERVRRILLASIGPVTSRAIREAGFTVAAEADPHNAAGLAAAIRRAVESRADQRQAGAS